VPGDLSRRVRFQPDAHLAMQRGVDQIVNAVQPTLGPVPRTVAVASALEGRPPELLDDGGLIARRIIQLVDPDEDMGAMHLRHLLWRLREQVGDGTATAAVLYKAIYDKGVRYLVSGGDATQLRRHLEVGMQVVLDSLRSMVGQVQGKQPLARVAETICGDPPLAQMLGEILDIIGEHGQLEIRQGRGRDIEREYVEGMYWKSGLHSRQMITDTARLRSELENASILISDLEVKEDRELLPVLEAVAGSGTHALLITCSSISDRALGLLKANAQASKLRCLAAKTPGLRSDEQADAMQELALLTGGRPFLKIAGDTLTRASAADLGQARRVWVDSTHLGVSGGQGDPRRLRQHIAELREAYVRSDDATARKRIQDRLGKLMGGAAVLSIGGVSDVAAEARKASAERTAEALRGAVREGVIPGGGVALLDCRPELRRRLSESDGPDQRAAYRILLGAVEAPIRTLLANAGLDAGRLLSEIEAAGPGHGCDVRTGSVVNMAEAGILDSAAVQLAALRGAVGSAALALTVDVLVHRRRPVRAQAP